jgi:hypothetical protein
MYDVTYLEALPDDALDEAVYDAKCHEASCVNNSGREAQIAWLVENGYAKGDIRGELDDYVNELEAANLEDDECFRTLLIRGMVLLSLNDDSAARFFDVSRPTVARWRNGSSKPFPVIREVVKRQLLYLAR